MKVITTGLLNRFWTKGIKPWLDKRIKSYADLMVTTASGYTPDALAVKEGFTELNGKLASKLAYVDFQLINGTGYTDIPMPTGFTYNNCISISLLVLYNGNIYFEDDISSFYVTIQNGKYQVYNSNNIFYGCTVGVAFMRTDI